MAISNWLESPQSFKKMLTALISDQEYRWERLKRDLNLSDPTLRQFAAMQWAQKRLPEDPDILSILTLFVSYQFRWLLVDSIRMDSSMEGHLQDELNVTLLLPLYIWPAYQIWVLQEFPAKLRLNQSQAIPWILNQPLRLRAFNELDIPDLDEKFSAYIGVKKNTTNLSRWITAGCESLLFVMHLATNNKRCSPIAKPKRSPKEVNKSTDEIPASESSTVKAGILLEKDMPNKMSEGDQRGPASVYLKSPIYQHYFQWHDAVEAFQKVQSTSPTHPSLSEIVRTIINQCISEAGLDLLQQAQTFELLSEIPEWIGFEKAPDASISLKSIEVRWSQFRKSDITPLIKALLEKNLLRFNGPDGRVCVAQPLVHDYLISMAQIKRLHSTNPIPPYQIQLTIWIYWLVCHWLESGDAERAGKTLWNTVGSLPGLNSGAWVQTKLILAHLPEEVVREPHIWLLAAIVQEVGKYNNNSLIDAPVWQTENGISATDGRLSLYSQRGEFLRILEDYRESLRRYHSVNNDNPIWLLEMTLGFDHSCKSDFLVRKHAFSTLKTFDPEKEVEIRLLPFVYQPRKLYEVILDFAKKENNWELKLAASECLVSWSIPEIDVILAEMRNNALSDEYYHRCAILRHALDKGKGYAKWV